MHRIAKWACLAVSLAFLGACANSSVDSLQSSLTGPEGVRPAAATTGALANEVQPTSVAANKADFDKLRALSRASATAYQIGAQDVLEVSVFKAPELSKVVQVADAGTINLPLVGEVPAAGRTAQDVERDLTRLLGCQVPAKPASHRFRQGIQQPDGDGGRGREKAGRLPLSRPDVTAAVDCDSGRPRSVASSGVIVFRDNGGKRLAARFDIDQIREGQAADPVLQSGDVVVVASSQIKETFNNVLKALPLAGVFALL